MVTVTKSDNRYFRTSILSVAVHMVYARDICLVPGPVELAPGGAGHKLTEVANVACCLNQPGQRYQVVVRS